MCTSSLEAQWICARGWDILLLRRGDHTVTWRSICSYLRGENALCTAEEARVGACEGHDWMKLSDVLSLESLFATIARTQRLSREDDA
jgi:hypothetical protein